MNFSASTPGTPGFFESTEGCFHYIDWGGSGPLAHFSHATGLCAATYAPLAGLLRPRLRMMGMDDRGHGPTRAPADPRRLKDWGVFVTDLERFCDHWGEPLVAMGHSRGATVSLLLAVRRPDLVRALVLIDPTILPLSWMWWWHLAKWTGFARRVPIVATAARRRRVWPDRGALLAAYRRKPVFQSWGGEFLEAYVAGGTQATENRQVKLLCDPAWESQCFASCPHDVWRHIPRLKMPVLVIHGADSDTFLPAAARRFVRQVPHAAMLRLADTGHFVPMQRPRETAKGVIRFLEANGILERRPVDPARNSD